MPHDDNSGESSKARTCSADGDFAELKEKQIKRLNVEVNNLRKEILEIQRNQLIESTRERTLRQELKRELLTCQGELAATNQASTKLSLSSEKSQAEVEALRLEVASITSKRVQLEAWGREKLQKNEEEMERLKGSIAVLREKLRKAEMDLGENSWSPSSAVPAPSVLPPSNSMAMSAVQSELTALQIENDHLEQENNLYVRALEERGDKRAKLQRSGMQLAKTRDPAAAATTTTTAITDGYRAVTPPCDVAAPSSAGGVVGVPIRMEPFHHLLPEERLGQDHTTLSSYERHLTWVLDGERTTSPPSKVKRYTLIVVIKSSTRSVLLGLKRRGFGTGFYNGFGGKIEATDASPAEGAVRELEEETNIRAPLQVMEGCSRGVLNFTFEDSNFVMEIHLFKLDLDLYDSVDASQIQACDEITPEWFPDWRDAPLRTNMFADDSVWYPILFGQTHVTLTGWMHFMSGGEATNTLLHRHLKVEVKDDGPHMVATPPHMMATPRVPPGGSVGGDDGGGGNASSGVVLGKDMTYRDYAQAPPPKMVPPPTSESGAQGGNSPGNCDDGRAIPQSASPRPWVAAAAGFVAGSVLCALLHRRTGRH